MSIHIEDLTVRFKNGVTAINHANLNIPNGIFGLLGENGAGKTTLMRVLTTVLKPTSGTVTLDRILYSEGNYEKIQRKIGYLPQEIDLYPNLTVQECLEYMGDLAGVPKAECKKRKEYFLKEKIYEYVMQNIEKALNNLCQDECDTFLENCNRVCAAKCGYEKMTGIVDYGRFCKLLNPSKVDEWDNELNLVETLSVDKIQSEIYELLYRSGTPE